MIAAGQCLSFSVCLFFNFVVVFVFFKRQQTFFLSCQLTIRRNDLYVVFTSIFQSFNLSHFFSTGKRIACKPSNDASFSLSFDRACVKEQLVVVLSSVSRRCLLFAEVLNYMHFGKL